MKSFLKSIAILSISASILLSLYGSVKMARAKGNSENPVEVSDYARQMKAEKKAFTYSGILFLSGVVLFLVGGRSK